MKNNLILLCLLALLMLNFNSYAATRYVKYDASGLNNGTSWTNAFLLVQSALDSAIKGDQIWVSTGVYRPTTKIGGITERFKTFQLKNGVSIIGGFKGTENDISQRDFQKNKTFISGDVGYYNEKFDNSYHIFYHPKGLNLDSTAILDGFEISDGNADGVYEHSSGSAMYNFENNPKIINSIFNENFSLSKGGAIYNENCQVTITQSSFFDNITQDTVYGGAAIFNNNCSGEITKAYFAGNIALKRAGAIYNFNTNILIENCIFVGNKSGDRGGAIVNDYNSSSIVKSVTFRYNESGWGGAVYNLFSKPQFTNCLFIYNFAKGIFYENKLNFGGGALANDYNADATITNCTFSENHSDIKGGAIYNYRSSTKIINSIIFNNLALESGNEIFFDIEGLSSISNSCVNNDSKSIVGLNYSQDKCINFDPKFIKIGKTPFAILGNSRCVDAGNNELINENYDIRGIGFERKLNCKDGTKGIVDMGAYEYKYGIDSININDFVFEDDVAVNKILPYPNPSYDFIEINIPANLNGKFQLKIIDFSGQELENELIPIENYSNNTLCINIKALSSGTYYIIFEKKSVKYYGKFEKI